MSLRIYNTLSRALEAFSPLEPGHVRMYVCGMTVYDLCHLGHARSMVAFDVVQRWLRASGYDVDYVRNITDIDDKIIRRAVDTNRRIGEVTAFYIDAMHADERALGVAPPDREPRATQYVGEMLDIIGRLQANGLAYQAADGDVNYAVRGFAGYGKLSGKSLDDLRAGERVAVDSSKRDPLDFVLWKAAKADEPEDTKWESPYGLGRPGWHIECSAMSRKYLGETFDIHGGGQDLIFPHHENEIAQSCGATGAEFARVWMHHGFVTIRDEKMSKSLGNFLTIRDVRAQYEPEVLRLFIFSTQYRNPLDFTETALQDARSGLERLYDCLARLDALPASGPAGEGMIAGRDRSALETLAQRFTQAMDNDFNTAQALGHLFDAVKIAAKVLRQLPDQPAAADLELLRATGATLRTLGGVLGILQQEPAGFVAAVRARMLAGVDLDPAEIEQLIDKRNRARADKDWATSDEVRDYLLAHGVALKDSPEGTTWEARER